MAVPFRLEWKLKALLEREGVTVYALAKLLAESSEEPLHITTLYRWANDPPNSPSLEGLGWVLWALGELTGKTYQLSDVVEFHATTK